MTRNEGSTLLWNEQICTLRTNVASAMGGGLQSFEKMILIKFH